jgi:zona occludens toxin
MIELYTGTPGSGKSFHVLAEGLYAARVQNKPVIANFPITNPPKNWHYVENMTVDVLVKFARTWPRKESRALLIIDEASRYFNSRDWQRNHARSMEWITFFSEHRKLGYDVKLVAQGDRMIDRQVRLNIEMERKHLRANRTLPFSLVPWPIFFVVSSWYAVPTMKHKLGLLFYRPWIGKRYDTLRLFHVGSTLLNERGTATAGGPGVQQTPAPYRKVHPVTRDTLIEGRGGRTVVGGEAAAPTSPGADPKGPAPPPVPAGRSEATVLSLDRVGASAGSASVARDAKIILLRNSPDSC